MLPNGQAPTPAWLQIELDNAKTVLRECLSQAAIAKITFDTMPKTGLTPGMQTPLASPLAIANGNTPLVASGSGGVAPMNMFGGANFFG